MLVMMENENIDTEAVNDRADADDADDRRQQRKTTTNSRIRTRTSLDHNKENDDDERQ